MIFSLYKIYRIYITLGRPYITYHKLVFFRAMTISMGCRHGQVDKKCSLLEKNTSKHNFFLMH